MSVDAVELPVIEVPKPHEDPLLTERVARFVLSELYHHDAAGVTERVPSQLAAMARMTTLAILNEAQVIATGSLHVVPAQTTLEDIVVEDEYARLGLGTRIVGSLEERAAGQGQDRIALVPAVTAVGFYEKLGYEPIHKQDTVLFKSLA